MTHVIQPRVIITRHPLSVSDQQEKPDGYQENQARILCHILDRQEAQQETEIEEGCDEAARSSRDK